MEILHNVDVLFEGTAQTLYMTILSTVFAYLLGLPLGVAIVLTHEKGLSPHKRLHKLLGGIVNIGRSVPFIILIIALMPLTAMIVGTRIGPNAAVFALVVAAIPFVARLVESALYELDETLIESAIVMGCTKKQVVMKIMLVEALPSIVRGGAITMITLVGYSAMAGAVGAGGLGDIAIRFGYHRYQYDMMFATIIILILIVQLIQYAFDVLCGALDKKNKTH